MKLLPIACLLIVGFTVPTILSAQKISEKDLIGTTWKLEIDVDLALEEAERELEEEDNLLGEIILSGVSGLVEGVIDNIDIYFEFREDNELKVFVEAFGKDDVDYTYWRITRRGELLIENSEHFNTDDDGSYWVYDDGIFIQDDLDEDDDAKVFLVKMD